MQITVLGEHGKNISYVFQLIRRVSIAVSVFVNKSLINTDLINLVLALRDLQ